jgi:uncharacterized Zn finger protein
LLESGAADAVLDLGETLFESGMEQVASSHDEGETASELGRCLTIVFQAVSASSRSDPDKLLYVIDLLLQDEYEVCHGADVVLDREWPASAWSAVADKLLERLRKLPAPKSADFSSGYRRDRLSEWAIRSLEHAGRQDEILPLCEAEAPLTASYERLVDRLIAAERWDDARRWALEGIEKTAQKWPGIADHLRERLRKIAEHGEDWLTVAAYRAEEFFDRPGIHTLNALQKAADQAGCGPAVRAAAFRFLETGQRPKAAPPPPPALKTARRRPARAANPTAAATGSAWPLPDPFAASGRPRPAPRDRHDRPHLDVLLHLALVEKRPDDILHWYDRMLSERRSGGYGWTGAGHYAGQVADAVAESHPERAMAIYRQIAEADIARTSPRGYEDALPWLRKLRDLLQRLNREAEWTSYLAELRDKNRRKRKLLETLDRLEGRRIVEG